MGFFDKFKSGLQRTHSSIVSEIKRIVSRSPKLTEELMGELESVLIHADLGRTMTQEILAAVRIAYEAQGDAGLDVLEIASRELAHSMANAAVPLCRKSEGPTIVSIVGVNGTGKTTTAAKLAYYVKAQGSAPILAACDTFRAAAIEQLKIWGQRLQIPVVAGAYGADPSSVAHDAVSAANAKRADYLFIDTAGRLHTKHNLMQELQKLHRVLNKQLPGAPHETLLVLDATTGMNALNQAREFHKAVTLTGLVITKLDGTSKGGMVVGIQKELGLPVKFIGLGEQPDDLQPFDPKQFAGALFSDAELHAA